MPKMKTRKGAAKRFKKTESGRVRRMKAYGTHLLTKKTSKRKRNLRRPGLISPPDASKVKGMISS